VLGEFGFSLSDQIDDALMCIDILLPSGRSLPAHTDSHSHKSEEGPKNFLGIAEEMGITGDPAKLQVKTEIAICQRVTVTCIRRITHVLHDGLQVGNIGAGSSGKITRHSFEPCANPGRVEKHLPRLGSRHVRFALILLLRNHHARGC
jgi:hypothetical protein